MILGQWEHVVGVYVLLLQYIFDIRGVERSLELLGKLIAAAQHVDRLQATTVMAFGALARFGGETAGVQFQPLDLLEVISVPV